LLKRSLASRHEFPNRVFSPISFLLFSWLEARFPLKTRH
jgi:hypothetical protein